MGVAQAVEAVIFPVGRPAIMDGGPLKSGQNTESVESFLATAGVHAHPGHVGGGGRVQPVEFTRDPHPGFIEMGHAGVPDGVRNARDGGDQISSRSADHSDHGARRQGYTTSVAQDLGGAQNRQHMMLGEVNDSGLYPWTILRGG